MTSPVLSADVRADDLMHRKVLELHVTGNLDPLGMALPPGLIGTGWQSWSDISSEWCNLGYAAPVPEESEIRHSLL